MSFAGMNIYLLCNMRLMGQDIDRLAKGFTQFFVQKTIQSMIVAVIEPFVAFHVIVVPFGTATISTK